MSTAGGLATAEPAAQAEVGALLSELIRINTSNPTHPERPAAEWVAGMLDEVGIRCQLIDAAPGRTSVVARIEGRDPRGPRCSSTATSTWSLPTLRNGRCIRSPATLPTGTSGDEAPWT